MPNLLLTYEHNGRCSYCFAAKRHQARQPEAPQHISWGDLVTAVNYFDEGAGRAISLMGGESTLHPEIVNIYRYLLSRNLTVELATNGCVADDPLAGLAAALAPDRTHFIVNVNEERDRADGETEQQAKFFAALGKASSLSFNLKRPDPDLDFLLETIDSHQLRRRIRLGLEHPVAGAPPNEVTPEVRPAQYADLYERIAQLAVACNQQDVTLSLDCGFTLCDFTDTQLGTLMRSGADLRFHCGPIIEIGPDLNTWACFPLHNLAAQPLEQYPSFEALRQFYSETVRKQTQQRGYVGVHSECEGCAQLKRSQCAGGCRSYAFAEGDL